MVRIGNGFEGSGRGGLAPPSRPLLRGEEVTQSRMGGASGVLDLGVCYSTAVKKQCLTQSKTYCRYVLFVSSLSSLYVGKGEKKAIHHRMCVCCVCVVRFVCVRVRRPSRRSSSCGTSALANQSKTIQKLDCLTTPHDLEKVAEPADRQHFFSNECP